MRDKPTFATLLRSDELSSPRSKAVGARVCQTTTAPNASRKNNAKVTTTREARRVDRQAITNADAIKATTRVRIAVRTIPMTSNNVAGNARRKVLLKP